MHLIQSRIIFINYNNEWTLLLEVEEEKLILLESQSTWGQDNVLIVDFIIGSIKDNIGYWLIFNISMATTMLVWKPAQEEHAV